MPRIVERYYELWSQHPQPQDPLTRPLRTRLCDRRAADDDEIPF